MRIVCSVILTMLISNFCFFSTPHFFMLSYAVFVTLLPYLTSSKPLFQEIWLLVNKAYCCVFALDYVVLVQVSTGCKRLQKPPNRVLQKFGRSGDVQ